jgi:glycosyltransferase involved in cell wall biosynthesis
MRIALYCHKFWPAVGGLCTYTGRLAEYLVGRGHEVRVFTSKSPPDAPEHEIVSERLHIRRFETTLANHPPYYFMPRLLRLAAASAVRDVDVVHTVGYYFFGSVFGSWTAKAAGVPHVTTPVYTLNPSSWQRRTFDGTLGRPLVGGAAQVIPQSAHELELLRAAHFAMRAHTVVPFGVDAAFFEVDYDVEDLRQRYGISADERSLLFVGKIMSPKGAFDCLEAVARLRRSGRKVRLLMIGDVHEREQDSFAARRSALGLQNVVALAGPIGDRREIARHYQLADAVLFPSAYEQFGIVAVEAAASGRPLLGTSVGIMQTLVPHYGFGLLHAPGDVERFTDNLQEVLDSPRYRENAVRHRREVLEQYDWRRISIQTEEIYARAVEELA